MKVLLLGADGQLGCQLRVALAHLGDVHAFGSGCDITDEARMRELIRELKPAAIVNAAAYTAVDRAQADAQRAFAVNAQACETLAREAQALGAWLVHYSTDYVFDGSGSAPWRESDPVAPLNVYGSTKLAGERAIQAHCRRHVILRTSWVYGAHSRNFLTAILDAARQRDTLTVVDDQWGAPTGVRLLADVTAGLLPRLADAEAGIYHCAPLGFTSRIEFARFALERAAAEGIALTCGPGSLRGVPTSDMPSPAARPLNSRLDTRLLRETFGITLPPWQDGVRDAVREIAKPTVGQSQPRAEGSQ